MNLQHTARQWCHALGELEGSRWTLLHMQRRADIMTAILIVGLWRLHQLMRIYLKNNPAKFHPDPIWNYGALGFFSFFFEARRTSKNKNKKKKNNKMSSDMRSVPDPETSAYCQSRRAVNWTCSLPYFKLFAPYCIFKIVFSYSAIQPQVCLINSVQFCCKSRLTYII